MSSASSHNLFLDNRQPQRLPSRNDLTPLTDANFVAKVLTELPVTESQQIGARTRWRGLRTKVEIAVLARDA